ncbi:MAG TPA: response regulator [Thermoanaerobaculia bacterium]|nr:response regulator [Thermoanaerobaculia bacterium]
MSAKMSKTMMGQIQDPILVVEDDQGIRTLLVAVLRRVGFQVEVVGNGRAALEALSRRRYAVVLMDLLMPGMNGYDLLKMLEETSPEFLSCTIVLTAASPAAIKSYDLDKRVFRVLRKPFDLEELLATVAACVLGRNTVSRDPLDALLGLRLASMAAHAKAGVVGMVGDSNDKLNLVWSFGYPADLLASFNPLPVTPSSPIGRAVLEQRPIWVHSLEETAQSFATLVPILREQKTGALAAVPITMAGSIVGCIGWSFEEPQAFAESQRGLLMQIAQEHGRTLALGS